MKYRKKRVAKTRIRNRYHRRAKLSEYKFLQVLQGFCDDIPAADLVHKTRVSEKTIRSTYKALRGQLYFATQSDRYGFGGAGFFLFLDGNLRERGRHFIEKVSQRKIFLNHMRRHGPRSRSPTDATDFLFEVTVRMFCNISMQKDHATLYPQETRKALETIREIVQWIRENQETEGFFVKYASLLKDFEKIVTSMPKLLEMEELQALKTKSVAHRFPSNVMYEDLRLYLLKNPL